MTSSHLRSDSALFLCFAEKTLDYDDSSPKSLLESVKVRGCFLLRTHWLLNLCIFKYLANMSLA